MPPLQKRGFSSPPSHGAISRAPAGVAAPWSRIRYGGEDCLSEALVLSNAKELSINNRALGKADSFLRQTLRKTQGVLRTGAMLGMTKERPPEGHARAPMVLGPFAETKGSRRAGPKPRKHLPPLFDTPPGLC